jgi:hypothetical protein
MTNVIDMHFISKTILVFSKKPTDQLSSLGFYLVQVGLFLVKLIHMVLVVFMFIPIPHKQVQLG